MVLDLTNIEIIILNFTHFQTFEIDNKCDKLMHLTNLKQDSEFDKN